MSVERNSQHENSAVAYDRRRRNRIRHSLTRIVRYRRKCIYCTVDGWLLPERRPTKRFLFLSRFLTRSSGGGEGDKYVKCVLKIKKHQINSLPLRLHRHRRPRRYYVCADISRTIPRPSRLNSQSAVVSGKRRRRYVPVAF